MVVGYRFFLKRMAEMMDSRENLTLRAMADRLNLRHGEFRDILNIMIKKGDIECIEENVNETNQCTGSCSGCSKLCAASGISGKNGNVRSYRLTSKGMLACKGSK